MRRMFLIAAALAFPLALAFPMTGGIAAGTTVPAGLVGTWGKTVTVATWQKNGVFGEPGGHWKIAIQKDGLTRMFAPAPMGNFTNMESSIAGSSLIFGHTFDGACPGKGSYTWKVSGSTLILKVVKDGCNPRRVLMTAGTFKRG